MLAALLLSPLWQWRAVQPSPGRQSNDDDHGRYDREDQAYINCSARYPTVGAVWVARQCACCNKAFARSRGRTGGLVIGAQRCCRGIKHIHLFARGSAVDRRSKLVCGWSFHPPSSHAATRGSQPVWESGSILTCVMSGPIVNECQSLGLGSA